MWIAVRKKRRDENADLALPGLLILTRQIGEPGHHRIELQLDGAGWSMTLLTDDQLGLAVVLVSFRQPFDELLPIRFRRLAHLMIVLLAEHEHDHVGVLLDRAG